MCIINVCVVSIRRAVGGWRRVLHKTDDCCVVSIRRAMGGWRRVLYKTDDCCVVSFRRVEEVVVQD